MPGIRSEQTLRSSSLWLVPLLCLLAGAALAVVTLTADSALGYNLVPSSVLGTPTAVQTILSTAASAMLTLTTIVLTILTLGVQVAMQQFSPRIVRALLSDRKSQLAHGLFAATFLFCMVTVARVDDRAGQIPSLTVVVAYALLATSVVTLVLYVHHAGQSLRVAGLIDLVGDNLRLQIQQQFPPTAPDLKADGLCSRESGVLVAFDRRGLLAAATADDCSFELCFAIGDFVPEGAPLLRRLGSERNRVGAFDRFFVLDNERSHVGDPAYGFRKLVDIAERSLAAGPFSDPTTAVQAIDRVHEGLRQLARRDLPSGRWYDQSGRLRLVTRELTWDGYVRIALDELRLVSPGSPQVTRRLSQMLDDLISVAPEERRPALQRQRERLNQAVRERVDATEAAEALAMDVQGLGSGADLIASMATPVRRIPDVALDDSGTG